MRSNVKKLLGMLTGLSRHHHPADTACFATSRHPRTRVYCHMHAPHACAGTHARAHAHTQAPPALAPTARPYSRPLHRMQPRSRNHKHPASCTSCRVLRAAAVQLRSQPPHPSSAPQPRAPLRPRAPRVRVMWPSRPGPRCAFSRAGATSSPRKLPMPLGCSRRSRSSTGGRRRRRTSRSRPR